MIRRTISFTAAPWKLSRVVLALAMMLMGLRGHVMAASPPTAQERMVEWTIESAKSYADPFNDVDVDVIFTQGEQSWRVPTFWRGGQRWTVRFAPPAPGLYYYRLESTDPSNPDLNGREGRVNIRPYRGGNALLQRGALRVSASKRYFEHADGTPFYWLGDIWWTGLSDRVSLKDFPDLVADRKAKGFTVIQTVAGLIPGEETCPEDAGCRNEGGGVWESGFTRINPHYFDYADQRIEQLIDAGMVPALVGAWFNIPRQMGFPRLKKHWRYLIARYGAYPVFWILGGEVSDPPRVPGDAPPSANSHASPGAWSDLARYIRAIDPYHHPLTVHETGPAEDLPLQEEALTDFTLLQPSNYGWGSIAIEVAQLNSHYARTGFTKPLVVGEVGIEMLGKTHLEDFQRVAFWLSMLNGAAGHTYSAVGLFEAVAADKPLQRKTWSFMNWREGMNLPGSYQIALGAKLLQRYPWWYFEPHPEWVTPRGTTLLEPREEGDRFHVDLMGDAFSGPDGLGPGFPDRTVPQSEWQKRGGNFRLPYAAGIPRKVRVVYIPYFGAIPPGPPTILGLELGVRYRAYYWEPSSGIEIDLGHVQRPEPGKIFIQDRFRGETVRWTHHASPGIRENGLLLTQGKLLSVVEGLVEENAVAGVDAIVHSSVGLIFRYRNEDNYLAAVYSARDGTIHWIERKNGVDSRPLGLTPTRIRGSHVRLTAEVRGIAAVVSVESAEGRATTPIVTISNAGYGGVGLTSVDSGQLFRYFEVRRSAPLPPDVPLDKKLFDAEGAYRGDLRAGVRPAELLLPNEVSWDEYGKNKHVLLDAYRPEPLPIAGDWVLVLEAK